MLIDGAHEVARTILERRTGSRSTGSPPRSIEHETLEADQVREILGDVEPWTHRTRPAAADRARSPRATTLHRARPTGPGPQREDHPVTDPNPLHAVPEVGATHPVDKARIERAVREILEAIGEDPDRDGLQRTPARVAAMYEEIFSGLHEDPSQHLTVTFEAQPRRDGDGPRHPALQRRASTT